MRAIPILLVLMISLASAPQVAFGQGWLVPCTGLDCSFCSAVQLVNNVIEFVIIVAIVIATIMLAVSGVRMVVSRGNPGAWQKAKDHLINVCIGILLIMAAWMIVDTLMKLLVSDDITSQFGFWNDPKLSGSKCGLMNPVDDPEVGNITVDQYSNNVLLTLDRYDDGSLISESGINGSPGIPPVVTTGSLVTYSGARFDAGVVDKIKYIDSNFDLRVSGGYRTPARNREVGGSATSYHLTGRAGDFVGSASAMEAAKDWADQNGARETLIHNAGSGTHLHVAW